MREMFMELLVCLLETAAGPLSPLGARVNGAQRWISVKFFSIQPLEFAKIALALYLAYFMTGKKLTAKKYFKHTGWIGGIKETTAGKVLSGRFPERVVEKAVERMISRNPMGRQQMTKLKVYAGSEHPHTAQNPEVLDIASWNEKNKRSAL